MTAVFQRQMQRLGGLKFAPTNLDTHWEALSDVPQMELDAAIARAQRECEEFPSPAMLRAFVADRAPRIAGPDEDRSVPLAQPAVLRFPLAGRDLPVTREWKFYCDLCEDTGWASRQCGTHGSVTCGRDFEHGPHPFVSRCACWDSNPAVLRRRERTAQQATHRATKRGDSG